MMHEIVSQRYDTGEWNVYAAQASDGDNWADDSPTCSKILREQLLPLTRYYAYIEITQRQHQSLWREYEMVANEYSHFAMKHIQEEKDIFPIFRELFKKEVERKTAGEE